MREIFEQIVKNFNDHFDQCHDKKFTTQNVDSCSDIYRLCKNYDPESVLEVGTNHGASTLSICLALKELGVSLDRMTTIDLTHDAWREAPQIQGGIPEIADMDLSKVATITMDFQFIKPASRRKKAFVFYDIHDHTAPFSKMFIDNWLPTFDNALVAIHDMSIVPDDYVIPESDVKRSTARYKDSLYSGFAECEVVVNWAIENGVTIEPFHSGVFFEIKDGEIL